MAAIDLDVGEALAMKAAALAAAASPGPWLANHNREMFIGRRHTVEGPRNNDLITGIAGAVEWSGQPPRETERSVRQRMIAHNDAEFIAASRAAVAELAAYVLALVARVRELEAGGQR